MARRHHLVISLFSVQPGLPQRCADAIPVGPQSQRQFCGLSFNQVFMPVSRQVILSPSWRVSSADAPSLPFERQTCRCGNRGFAVHPYTAHAAILDGWSAIRK